ETAAPFHGKSGPPSERRDRFAVFPTPGRRPAPFPPRASAHLGRERGRPAAPGNHEMTGSTGTGGHRGPGAPPGRDPDGSRRDAPTGAETADAAPRPGLSPRAGEEPGRSPRRPGGPPPPVSGEGGPPGLAQPACRGRGHGAVPAASGPPGSALLAGLGAATRTSAGSVPRA